MRSPEPDGWVKRLNRFQFHWKDVRYEDMQTSFSDFAILVSNSNLNLAFERNSLNAKFHTKRLLIDIFQVPRPKRTVHLNGSPNHFMNQFISYN